MFHHWVAFRRSRRFACLARTTLTRRIYTANVQFEQQLADDLSMYFDFTHSKGVHLTRFINLNQSTDCFRDSETYS